MASVQALSGGMVGSVRWVDSRDGRTVVVKTSAGVDLRTEALMLRTLRERSPLPVPEVLHASEAMLILEPLPGRSGVHDAAAERHLAELLAMTHDVPGEAFGFDTDTLLGPFELPNDRHDDGVVFFRDQRLRWALGHARASGNLPDTLAQRVERIAARLPDSLNGHRPVPVLLHGDLWSGNVLSEPGRLTGVLDPAVHYGDAETELAFIDLFGGVDEAFWRRYDELRGVPEAFFEHRRWIWQLVPALVHLALFGGTYLGLLQDRIERIEAAEA